MDINHICLRAYEILTSSQDEFGEFGKNCLDIIHNENSLRHPVSQSNAVIIGDKPNCSVTLIAALGISCYKGVDNTSVIGARRWFTESSYISKGWFRQQVHVVDANPFGHSIPQVSEVTDIRHTATALLAALCFKAQVTFISDALRNLLADDCRDYNNKGWRADMGVKHAPADFYTTVYMLASLYYLKSSMCYKDYGLKSIQVNQLLNNGLNAICSKSPHELGYNSSVEQTLRTNGTILFFLAPLLADVYPDYLEESVEFIIYHAQKHKNGICWMEGDFDVTVNILAGLIMAEKYIDKRKIDIDSFIEGTKHFIEITFDSLPSFHPVSLGFVLFIYSNKTTYYPELRNTVSSDSITKLTVIDKDFEENVTMDILIMVATEEEEKAITSNENFEERELDDGIIYLIQKNKGFSIALARGFEYGELDAAIMAQTLYMELKPKIIAMAGFCAGQRGKQILGDVVIAEKIFNYDQGKQIAENKIEPQISSYKLDGRFKQRIERYRNNWRDSIKINPPKDFELQCFEFLQELSKYKDGIKPNDIYDRATYPNWNDIVQFFLSEHYIRKINNDEQIILSPKGHKHLNELILLFPEGVIPKEPTAMLGVLATGTKVQQWDGIFNYLNSQFDRKCSVLDMEGHAMAKIAEFNKCPFIVAKGVGDFAQNGKKFHNRFINYAVYSSYRFIIEFLEDNIVKLGL